jgi:hypothetical protein
MRRGAKTVSTERIIKAVGLNLGIAVFDITILSSFDILERGKSLDDTTIAFLATIILMSIIVFAYGNYKLLFQKEKSIQPTEIRTIEDCISALKQNYNKKTFLQDINIILEQIARFQNKKVTIEDILLQKFDRTEMSYSKFHGAILDVENVFYINIKSIINRMNAFDEVDYNQIRKGSAQFKFSKEFIEEKISIYNEYISFVKASTEDNEEILLKLDRLLLEISKFNSLEDGEIENMDAMKEIDELINKAKLYK